MTEKELWNYFWNKKAFHAKPLDRDFVWISQGDFESVEPYFIKEFNVLHRGRSFRSKGYWSHIHAVIQDDFVLAHIDTGNLARFFPLGLVHFACDVLPYLVYAKFKKVSLRSIFLRPK